MAHISIKRIGKNKRPYAYLQTSKRVGKKIKTTSRYLGPVNAKGVVSVFSSKTWDALAKMEIMPHHAEPQAPVKIDGMKMTGEGWTAESAFNHESGIESAAPQDGTSAISDEAGPPSQEGNPSSEEE